jgi:hypothetical protein
MKHVCDNCGKKWDKENVVYAFDLQQRIDPGGIMPTGECPDCGALCYPDKAPENQSQAKKKVYITMDGGLIHCITVTKDLKDVDFIIIDFDVEGRDDDEVSLCNGEEAYVMKGKADEIAEKGQFKFKFR